MPLQRSKQHGIAVFTQLWLADDNDIQVAQLTLVIAKTLADDALEAVADHGGLG